jgi:hypothetical protein
MLTCNKQWRRANTCADINERKGEGEEVLDHMQVPP